MTASDPSAMQDAGLARHLLAAVPDPRPAGARPPTPAGRAPAVAILHAVAQLLGLAAVVAAVAVLAGWPWALLLGGVLLAGVSLVTEYLAARPPPLPPVTAEEIMRNVRSRGDR